MSYNTKVSIITPSYNSAAFIEQTIDSVLSQAYPKLQFIVIDGGSTDGTVDIIKKYEKYLSYWVSEPDKGQSHAINKGLKKATGEVVNWLNADDFYEKGSLLKIVEGFQDPSVDCLCGRSNIVDEKGVFIQKSLGTDIYENSLTRTIGWARIDQPETFFRRTVFEKLRGVNEQLHYVMDKELWIRYLAMNGLAGIKRTEDVVVNFRIHENSKTGAQKSKFEEETDQLYLKLAESFGYKMEEKIFASFTEEPGFDFAFPAKLFLAKEDLKEVLHYYLLHKADYFYYHHKRGLSKACLQYIDRACLDAFSQKLFDKLKCRTRFFPVGVVKMFRQQ
ncbi:glycosyltransferase family 2 protein [Nafulsella turpanensis]|uniref:glycosyltransferase family 2 protein n=1 Tax=Nafulsella turpanensis TaxID=1265690 RepID=UPI0003455A21|nr:glycosyltransferase family 2 protein [Nafulsella turpanensis]